MVEEKKCSGNIKGIHSFIYVGNLSGMAIYRCESCGILKEGKGNKIINKERPPIQLSSIKSNQIIITGRKLSCRWLDSYILVYSKENHQYEE